MAQTTSHDVEQWKKHFIAMAEGKLSSDTQYSVGKTLGGVRQSSVFTVSNQHGSGAEGSSVIKFVSPVTQTVERARATVKRKTSIKRKTKSKKRSQSKKRTRSNKSATVRKTKIKSRRKKAKKSKVKRSKKVLKDIFS